MLIEENWNNVNKFEQIPGAKLSYLLVWNLVPVRKVEISSHVVGQMFMNNHLRWWLQDPVWSGWNSVLFCQDPGNVKNSLWMISCSVFSGVLDQQPLAVTKYREKKINLSCLGIWCNKVLAKALFSFLVQMKFPLA